MSARPHPLIVQLRKHRIHQRLSTAAVAKRLRVSQSAVTHWETGFRRPRADQIDAYAALFDLRLGLVPMRKETR